jgi:hypothetical protein
MHSPVFQMGCYSAITRREIVAETDDMPDDPSNPAPTPTSNLRDFLTARNAERFEITWRGIVVEILYCAPCFALYEELYGYPLAHIQIQSISPKNAALPITETGFKSHFMRSDDIQAEGGPVLYVQGWLDFMAEDPRWSRKWRTTQPNG